VEKLNFRVVLDSNLSIINEINEVDRATCVPSLIRVRGMSRIEAKSVTDKLTVLVCIDHIRAVFRNVDPHVARHRKLRTLRKINNVSACGADVRHLNASSISADLHVCALGINDPARVKDLTLSDKAEIRTLGYLKDGAFASDVTIGPKYVRGKTF